MKIKIIPYSSFSANNRRILKKKSEDGFSVEIMDKMDKQWIIYYNDSKDFRRINNTIMHEVGHIVLDHTEDSELAEKEVKFFAKYALAPPVLIHKLNLTNAVDIAEIFKISHEAAEYAYSYYCKWHTINSIKNKYTDYESDILDLFSSAS